METNNTNLDVRMRYRKKLRLKQSLKLNNCIGYGFDLLPFLQSLYFDK